MSKHNRDPDQLLPSQGWASIESARFQGSEEDCGEGREAGGVIGLGKLLEREMDKRGEKKDIQTEFQETKNETQPSHVFVKSLGLMQTVLGLIFFLFTQEGGADVPESRPVVSLFSFS